MRSTSITLSGEQEGEESPMQLAPIAGDRDEEPDEPGGGGEGLGGDAYADEEPVELEEDVAVTSKFVTVMLKGCAALIMASLTVSVDKASLIWVVDLPLGVGTSTVHAPEVRVRSESGTVTSSPAALTYSVWMSMAMYDFATLSEAPPCEPVTTKRVDSPAEALKRRHA